MILWCDSEYAHGMQCTQCGHPASHKVGEEIFPDDPNPVRHEFTSYLCCYCFSSVMGLRGDGTCPRAREKAAPLAREDLPPKPSIQKRLLRLLCLLGLHAYETRGLGPYGSPPYSCACTRCAYFYVPL